MKLSFHNAILILLAAVTLYGGLFNPAVPEQAPAMPMLTAYAPSTDSLIPLSNSTYLPLHELMNLYDGQLTYNRETDTIDLTVDSVPFTLLLTERSVLQNGYESPGDFYIENGLLYMNADQFKKLSACSAFSS